MDANGLKGREVGKDTVLLGNVRGAEVAEMPDEAKGEDRYGMADAKEEEGEVKVAAKEIVNKRWRGRRQKVSLPIVGR